MKNFSEVLDDLNEKGVELWFEGDTLRFRAPKGALQEDDRAMLVKNKAGVINILKQRAFGQKLVYPLIHSQRALWFIHQVAPDSAAYHVAFSARIRSDFNMEAFGQAVQAVVDRHSSLRTTYTIHNGEPVQEIHGYMKCRLQVRDASGAGEVELKDMVVKAYKEPFDLEKGNLLRVHVFVRSENDHVLLINAHHIACDGWSAMLLLDELRALYAAKIAGTTATLPHPTEFNKYIEWQRTMLEGESGQRLFSFWQKKLNGELPILSLPADRPRPSTLSYNGSTHPFAIDADLTARLKSLAREQRSTLFTTLLASFYVMLHRYTGQEDILIGSPTYGRSRIDFSSIVGDLINTVTFRGKLSGNSTFIDFLADTRRNVLEVLEHQDYPFPLLVEKLCPDRDSSRSPIYQALFILQKFSHAQDLQKWMAKGDSGNKADFGGLKIEPFMIPQQEGQIEIVLEMTESGGQLFGNFKYNNDIYEAETINCWVGSFKILLEDITSNPGQRLSQIAVLTKAERHQLLVEWNATQKDYPTDKTLLQLFEEQAQRTPEATAVVCAGRSLNFTELNCKANQVAHYLRALGVQPDSIVGICVDRSLDMVVGLLGILKAGGAYAPFDPHFPADRIEFMLQDSNSRILITQSHLQGNVGEFSGEVIYIDSDWDRISKEKDTNPKLPAGPSDLAYVIYTSGSTGKPKGVQIPHRALVNFLCSMRAEPGLKSTDTLLSVTTMSFDIFGLELFLPLITGAKVVIAEQDDTLDGFRLANLLKDFDVSVMQATPSTWRFLIESGWSGYDDLKVICGGEAFPSDLVGPLLDRCGELWNLYGPTETTIWSTAYRVKSKKDPMLIGRPIANTQIYILDSSLQPVPRGVVGELYIGGDGLSRGYLNRPELTAEKFIAHPFSEDAGARIYMTGDLARYRQDCKIECLGRIDHQVKLRGFRIELGEIEAHIKDVQAVNNCVVLLREDYPGDRRLVAYYVPKQGYSVSISDLRGHLIMKLPDYMVPQHFLELASIPLTPNGKVDRNALPKPEAKRVADKEYVAPRSEAEHKVATIWQEVLKLEKVGLHDNFFDLGGNSLLAIQLMSRIAETFKIVMSLNSLLEAQTIEQFVAKIDSAKSNEKLAKPLDASKDNGIETSTVVLVGSESRTSTERHLLSIWKRILNKSHIGIRDSFFDLQGDANLFNSMLAEVRTEFGVFAEGLPISAINQDSTIETLSRTLDESKKQTSTLVVPLQPCGSKHPLFLIHAGGGYVFFYRALSYRLGEDRPVYGVRAEMKSDGRGRPFDQSKSIEDLAAQYVVEIKTVQPQGPYFVGGASLGGVIAFEMARQLQSQGEELGGPVLLFSAIVANNLRARDIGIYSPANLGHRIAFLRSRASAYGLWKGVWYLTYKVLRNIPYEIRSFFRAMRCSLWTPASEVIERLESILPLKRKVPYEVKQKGTMKKFMATAERLLYSYIPGLFGGSVVMLNSSHDDNLEQWWAGLAQGGITVYKMPGGHLDMLEEPTVFETAALVRKHLDEYLNLDED